MIIGVPKEIKTNENRVAITPAGVHSLVSSGNEVFIETNAGLASNFTDDEYIEAGAKILKTGKEIYKVGDMIMKVKEPLESEYDFFKENQIIFTYFHLAAEPALTKVLLEKGVIAIAYETVQLPDNSLPLLSPMSEVAGKMSVQVGAHLLEKINNGRGILLGGVSGVAPGEVLIVGGGNVGTNAAKVAIGLGAHVTIVDLDIKRLAYLDDIFAGKVTTLMSNSFNIAEAVEKADLIIGAVLIPGAKAPKLVKEYMVKTMKAGSVIVDVAIDQGGVIETSDRITSHDNPYYIKHGIVHYSVPNMPGAVPRTSTLALTNATMPYAVQIANKGCERALVENSSLIKGLNIYKGMVTYRAVAEAFDYDYISPEEAIQF